MVYLNPALRALAVAALLPLSACATCQRHLLVCTAATAVALSAATAAVIASRGDGGQTRIIRPRYGDPRRP